MLMPHRSSVLNFIFGRLTLSAIPYTNPILIWVMPIVVVMTIALLAGITYYGKWGYLWREWFTTMDPKRLGIMYLILAIVMLVRGFADALMMRLQQGMAFGSNMGYLPPHHYDQIFSAHGSIMIFFAAMPIIIGLMNFVMPLQIGARDVAFPFLNNFSFWMTAAGALLFMISLFIGDFARTGWLAYPPVSELKQSPGVGVDYYIWGLQLSGVGSLLTGVNFLVTILRMRAPGMTLMKMPLFTWTSLCTSALIVAAFPVLTATLALLAADRYLGTHFFTTALGGNLMLYINFIWIWGHPEVYILILPLFGVYSEIVATFSGKRLFGYSSMVYATVVIMILSYLVWLHHFFTMGSGSTINAFFALTTMLISIPTGVKYFNWLFTMYRGRIRFELPMLWTMGFLFTFAIGGMSGVMLSVAPSDFILHNSLFVVAHFHNVIIGGVVFGFFAALTYWFPKATGFHMDPFWGKVTFWFWQIGFWVAFAPLYVLGLMGVTRRLSHFTDPSLQIWFRIAEVGSILILCGILAFLMQLYVSFRDRERLRDKTAGDPWNGRTLEWSTASPPPPYNFAFTPIVHARDAWTDMKQRGIRPPTEGFNRIHMPRNTGTGVIMGALAFTCGFGLIWYIWWMAALSFVGFVAVVIWHSFNYHRDYYIPSEVVDRTERGRVHDLNPEAI